MLAVWQHGLFFLVLFKCNPNVIINNVKLLVAGFSHRRPGFNFSAVRVGYLVEKVTLRYNFSEYF
jgi:hypothetical protein